MKRILACSLCLFLICALSSCASEKNLNGTWYNDTDDVRNAVQFYQNDEGKNVFVWAIYDLVSNEVTSNAAGYYTVQGNTVTLEYSSGEDSLTLNYTLDGDTLTLQTEAASLKLTKYVLDSATTNAD